MSLIFTNNFNFSDVSDFSFFVMSLQRLTSKKGYLVHLTLACWKDTVDKVSHRAQG